MQNSQFPSFVSYLIPNLPISDSLVVFFSCKLAFLAPNNLEAGYLA